MGRNKKAPGGPSTARGQKRKAVLLAGMMAEDAGQVKTVRALRDDLAAAAFAHVNAGRGFCRGLSLSLDAAQVELESLGAAQ
ncbi:MAG: hypothetical protein AB7E51_14665 [Pseudodesulfovibrio sp.]|uniref:hypothetical protein n=1 Tax=Pseudodesulfovibrio sp. TaxID=2035812 RepID=UPI003D0C5B53